MSETVYDSEAGRLRSDATASVTRDETRRLAPASAPRDAVRWGPILAGFLVALGTFVLLSLLLLGLGASAVEIGPDDADTAATGVGAATLIAGLISFLLGGFVAARTAAVRDTWPALLNGLLVWALGLLLILLLSAFGIGQLFGEAGSLIGRFGALRSELPEGVTADDVARGVREAAMPAFLSLALPAAAAALGGLIGSQEDLGFELRRRTESPRTATRPDAPADIRR